MKAGEIRSLAGMEMLWIPPGTFEMGSPEDDRAKYPDEAPLHSVTISNGFWLGRYTVTFAQYDAFCDATGKQKPDDWGWGRGKRPVIDASWSDAVAYCEWLSARTREPCRLPTEAEWEYACRAGTRTRYSFGDSENALGEYAWYRGNSGPHEVGTKKPNPWGLHDMHGNVLEWCADWHDSDYYECSPTKEPHGPSSGRCRVKRGGCWLSNARLCRSAYRDSSPPDNESDNLGFRLLIAP